MTHDDEPVIDPDTRLLLAWAEEAHAAGDENLSPRMRMLLEMTLARLETKRQAGERKSQPGGLGDSAGPVSAASDTYH